MLAKMVGYCCSCTVGFACMDLSVNDIVGSFEQDKTHLWSQMDSILG